MYVKKEDCVCPNCGSNNFYPDQFAKDNVFWCQKEIAPKKYCKTVICYCEQCKKYYTEDKFGKRNDTWECKICGKTHWGLTEKNRSDAELKELLSSARKGLSDFWNSRY